MHITKNYLFLIIHIIYKIWLFSFILGNQARKEEEKVREKKELIPKRAGRGRKRKELSVVVAAAVFVSL